MIELMVLKTLVCMIPVFPVLAAVWIAESIVSGRVVGEAAERWTGRVALLAATASLLALLVLDGIALFQFAPGHTLITQWLLSGSVQVNVSFMLDTLGLGVATLFAILNLLTLRFSINYLHREAGFQRFFLILSLFNTAMMLITLSGNLVMTFAGWELAGVSSYLLIAYAYDRKAASKNASRAFITNRIGDVGFLFAIGLLFLTVGTVEWIDVFALSATVDRFVLDLIVLGLAIAALAKSAQFPFVSWIARALEGPTPSSAVFYGAVMVHAGVFLMIRLEPLLVQVPVVMGLLLVLGFLTVIYGYIGGLVQTDIKSSLMFATTAQTGLMFIEIGLGWFDLAAWHLVIHAAWRAYQFLHAPALMHLTARSTARPVPKIFARSRRLYLAAIQRFWLDHLIDWMLVRPVEALSRDLQEFERRVVHRFVGMPKRSSAISSVAHWEAHTKGMSNVESNVGRGVGVLGGIMESVARILHSFEEKMVLQSGGSRMMDTMRSVGSALQKIEELLSQPRYLLLIIIGTFLVIL